MKYYIKSLFSLYFKVIKESLINLPSPVSLNYMWNFGSLLGMVFMIQIISGIFLSLFYSCKDTSAFNSLVQIHYNVNYGWIIRFIHVNGASLFFIFIYSHLFRNLFYKTFFSLKVWFIGVTIIFISILVAFMGYVLPWGQMSYWGATVITNLISVIPFVGSEILEWVWGGFSVSNATLTRLYSLHFIMPFLLIILVSLHLLYLHNLGSSSPLGISSDSFKVYFYPYFWVKDLVGGAILMMIYFYLIFFNPYVLMDPDNWSFANSMVTPKHIQPEWYFLFAYSVLRSVTNKLGGVLAMVLSIAILYILVSKNNNKLKSGKFEMIWMIFFSYILMFYWLLTWLGMNLAVNPFDIIGEYVVKGYFFLMLLMILT